jgi:glycosyltransferase involved in cell wall biosynthesis
MSTEARVLLIAEAANPEWVSVPLIGWCLSKALRERINGHLVTQTRNRDAILRAGWREGEDFTIIDTEDLGRPIWKAGVWLKKITGLGWTTSTALAALPYYLFEHRLWERFGPQIENGAFDVVHRITPLTPTTPSILAPRCRRAGVPFVWGPVNGGVAWPPGFSHVLRAEGEWLSYVRKAHHLLPGYESTRRDASALIIGSRSTWAEFDGYHDRSIYIPENAVEPARFGEPSPPPEDGPLRAAFIGRLVPYKGADMLIEAAAPLVREGKLELEILGDGPQRKELEELVDREGVRGKVNLRGWIAHSELHPILRSCHVFAFPSVREFGGGVVLEAMLLGIPPIVVDYAGPAELVTERTGVRIPIGSRSSIVDGFRKKLTEFAADRSALQAIGQRARQRVLDWYTWQRKAEQICDVYSWVRGLGPKPNFGMPFRDE